jgi:PAS domain S-box-containing protein
MPSLLAFIERNTELLLEHWSRRLAAFPLPWSTSSLREQLRASARDAAAELGEPLATDELEQLLPFLVRALTAAVTARASLDAARLQELSDSEQQLQNVADALPVLVSYVTPDGRYGMANKAYESWFSVPRESIIGKTLREVVGDAAWEKLRPFVERGLAGEALSFEQLDVPYRLGGTRDIRVKFVPNRDASGRNQGYIALLEDITRERAMARENEALLGHAQEARAEASAERDRQHALFMQAPVGIAILEGTEHRFTFANPAYRVLVRGREVVGKTLTEALPDLSKQGFQEQLDDVLATGEPHTGREVRVHFSDEPDDQPRFLSFSYTPKRNGQGEVDGVLVSGWDVTEQVTARQHVDGLRRAAEEANRSKDEFLAMLGHEMRNPLAPIATALQLMRLRASDTFVKERDVIGRQVEHLTHLVDDLLDVSRITSGKVELHRERLNLAGVVARAIEVASPLIEQRQHHLAVSVPAHELYVEGDALRLTQVLSNLLTNAAKYTEASGTIEIIGRRDGAEVELRVRDNGIGIAATMLPRVFELFTQERQSIERARGGLGLGLSIVRSLITMHGGSVTANSAGHGKGSEFIVRLPASSDTLQADTPSRPRHARPTPPGTIPLRVLLVDDNVDAAALLAATLECLGHETRVAHDGPSALAVVEGFTPDVAILDIGLPVMDGYELAGRLRARPELARARLIALTGYGQSSDRERSLAAGFDAHCVKPVQLSTLEALMVPTALGA